MVALKKINLELDAMLNDSAHDAALADPFSRISRLTHGALYLLVREGEEGGHDPVWQQTCDWAALDRTTGLA